MTARGRGEPWHGIFPYLVSPVDERGRVRRDVLARLVRRLIDAGVHGLSPLGSTGEFPYLSPSQRLEVVRTVVEAAEGRVPVVPGVGAFATADAIEQTTRLLEAGADGIVLILLKYFALPADAVTEFFASVAQAVPCPVVLYSNPRLLGAGLTPEQAIALSRISNIRYFKDASGETGNLLTVRMGAGERLAIFSASAHIPTVVLRLGGVGWMAGPACLIPQQCVALYDLAVQGRWAAAEALARRLWPLSVAFQRHSLAACVKCGLGLQGIDAGDPVPPQRPVPPAAREEIRAALAEAERPAPSGVDA